MIIEKKDIATLDKIRGYKQVGKEEVSVMSNFISKYIEKKEVSICNYCSAQIVHAWNRIINWSNKHSDEIEQIRNVNSSPSIPKQNDELPNCICGKKLADKRFKYCSKKCRKDAKR